MQNVLELNDILKVYQKHVAVNKVSFSVPKGSIFGLLGPNGAGKTTLIRIITTIIRADSGQVILDGEKRHASHPRQIGYMPEERGLYRKMKVGEHLLYLAQLKGLSKPDAKLKIEEWLERFQISDWQDKKVEELSKGMQQKIQFIATVVHQPALLILDEPFSGLDPINTNLIKEEIFRLRENGATILFSTHRMEQVEEICEQIVLINKGKNILEGNVRDIKEQFKENRFRIQFTGTLPAELLQSLEPIQSGPEEIIFQVDPSTGANEVLQQFLNAGVQIREFKELLPSLNQVFIKQVASNA